MGLAQGIFDIFIRKERFTLKEAYKAVQDKPETTVRARIYDNLGILFKRIGKGVYAVVEGCQQCVLIEGDGRRLDMLEDESIDCIITDHPWLDLASNKGGNRSFADYECFSYTLDDFKEKARVLKPGSFRRRMRVITNSFTRLSSLLRKAAWNTIARYPGKKGTLSVTRGVRPRTPRIS